MPLHIALHDATGDKPGLGRYVFAVASRMRSQLIKVRNILEAQGRGFQSIASRSKEAKVVGPRSLVMLQHLDEPRVVCVQLGPVALAIYAVPTSLVVHRGNRNPRQTIVSLPVHTAVCWFYRKPYASAQCVRAAGDSSTLTMIK